jgi:hypothetical protein
LYPIENWITLFLIFAEKESPNSSVKSFAILDKPRLYLASTNILSVKEYEAPMLKLKAKDL